MNDRSSKQASIATTTGIAIRREVDDLFQQAVPLGNTVPRDELKDLVPDAELSLPAFNVVTGSYDPRSLKSTLLEFKTMRYGVKYTSVPRATAVDRFERSLLGDIQRGLAARDAAWHNTEPGHKGPLRDILDMSEYTGMVFGTVGEVSKGVHRTVWATPTLEPDAGANALAPMWAVELRAAHTRVVDECGNAVLEDLAGPLASALKLLPSKRSHVARAGCSAAGAEPASAMRSAADLQAIPHYSDFPLHSMRKVQETLSHRIHTVRFAKLAARMPTSGPDSNRFRGRLLRAATAFLVTDPPSMLARFEDVGVDFTPSTWAVAYADHVARCSGGDSNHAAHEWAAHGLFDICHDVKSALGVGVQILTDPSVLVSLPKGSDGRPADVGLFGYGGIRGNTVAVDTTIAPIFGVSSSDPTTALRAAERHKIQKYEEGVRKAAGMLRFVPFAVSEFGSLAPHAEAFLVELAKASHTHTGQKKG
eukprot:jgi/Tetstr1/460615/TSEL_000540.t1